ncbi:MAG: glycoside hydrolase family 18 protein [Caldilineaceae bacterium]
MNFDDFKNWCRERFEKNPITTLSMGGIILVLVLAWIYPSRWVGTSFDESVATIDVGLQDPTLAQTSDLALISGTPSLPTVENEASSLNQSVIVSNANNSNVFGGSGNTFIIQMLPTSPPVSSVEATPVPTVAIDITVTMQKQGTSPQATIAQMITRSAISATPVIPIPTPSLETGIILPNAMRLIGYYESRSIYATPEYLITDIPADKLTHLIYTPLNVSRDGECELGNVWADRDIPYETPDQIVEGNLNRLNLLKQQNPGLKILLSVGVSESANNFSDAVLTSESRQRFAVSCIQFMKQYGFDGLEIDWRYPVSGEPGKEPGRSEDKENYTLLLAELRKQLDTQSTGTGSRFLLTITAPGLSDWSIHYDLLQMIQYIDWITILAYDFQGFTSTTGFAAPIKLPSNDTDPENVRRNIETAVKIYLDADIVPDKLVLSVPFFGYGWTGVSDTGDGLYKTGEGKDPGTWNNDGRINYSDLKTRFLPTYVRYWSDEALVPWLYNPTTGIWVSYDDADSLAHKVRYAQDHQLGGVAVWSLGRDEIKVNPLTDDKEATLFTAVYDQWLKAASIPTPSE